MCFKKFQVYIETGRTDIVIVICKLWSVICYMYVTCIFGG